MDPPPYTPRQTMGAQDFDRASIHSIAPSYKSEAPTYVSTLPSPPSRSGAPYPSSSSGRHSGLPSPYDSLHRPRASCNPSLDAFRMPDVSYTTTNPSVRIYQSVAQRRAQSTTIQEQATLLSAALDGEEGIARMKRRADEEERERSIRILEDPDLVGEVAAEEARQERLRKENGWSVLEAEDKRWDWLLAQMNDWEERDRSWAKFRQEVEGGKRHKLAKRLGISKGRN